MQSIRKFNCKLVSIIFLISILFLPPAATAQEKVGVLLLAHGGMTTYSALGMWDAAMTQFYFNPNHSVYKWVIWNPDMWGSVLDTEAGEFALKYIRLFDFEYERIGGTDPYNTLTVSQMADIKAELDTNPYGIQFEIEWAGFQTADSPEAFPYPRGIYNVPADLPPFPGFIGDDPSNCTYCGEFEKNGVVLNFDAGSAAFTPGTTLTGQTSGATAVVDDVTLVAGSWGGADAAGFIDLSAVSGSFQDNEIIIDDGPVPGTAAGNGTSRWPGCDPERFNVDGPVERLLAKGVTRIIAVDWIMAGIRYSKGYDVVQTCKRVLDDWNAANGTSVDLVWVNDYTNLLERSYPADPEGWTAILGPPIADIHVPLETGPNPVAADPELTVLQTDAIDAAMSPAVPYSDTAVLFVNHAMHMDGNEVFDPKMDDTVIVMENIKAELLSRHPTMDPDNIIGSALGKPELNPANGLVEHTRRMRGEVYGYAWLYESDKQLAGGEWGFRTWDALEHLKNRGVRHIVISNTHIAAASVLDLVEMPNQIAREIGYKTWALWGTFDYAHYPGIGHPFADYWGTWLNTDCGEWELDYISGTAGFSPGGLLTGQTSGATGLIKWLSGNSSAGTLTLAQVSGTFQDGEVITDDSGGSSLADGMAVVTSEPECCFEMGGCGDPLRPFPPPRQRPINQARNDLDPSLAYDISAYGEVGYDPGLGAPDNDNPVQDQYTGTWAMYKTSDDDPRVGALLAKHVFKAAYCGNGFIDAEETCGEPGLSCSGGEVCTSICECLAIPATLVELSEFKAKPRNSAVRIVWSTESEIDHAGFNLYRAGSKNGTYVKLNDSLIPAKGAPTQGAEYEFVDEQAQNRRIYFYELEDIDQNGTATRHGPVRAMPLRIYGPVL